MKYGFEATRSFEKFKIEIVLMDDGDGRYEGGILQLHWRWSNELKRWTGFEITMPTFNYFTFKFSTKFMLALDKYFMVDDGTNSPEEVTIWLAKKRSTERVWYDPRQNRHVTKLERKPTTWQLWGDNLYFCRVLAPNAEAAKNLIHLEMQKGAGKELYAKWISEGSKVTLEQHQFNVQFDDRTIEELLA